MPSPSIASSSRISLSDRGDSQVESTSFLTGLVGEPLSPASVSQYQFQYPNHHLHNSYNQLYNNPHHSLMFNLGGYQTSSDLDLFGTGSGNGGGGEQYSTSSSQNTKNSLDFESRVGHGTGNSNSNSNSSSSSGGTGGLDSSALSPDSHYHNNHPLQQQPQQKGYHNQRPIKNGFRYLPNAPFTFDSVRSNYRTLRKTIPRSSLLQDRESDLEYYQTFFVDRHHYNYVAEVPNQGPLIVSMVNDEKGTIRLLVRTTQGSRRIEYSSAKLTQSSSWINRFLAGFGRQNGLSHARVLGQICPDLPIKSLTSCFHPLMEQELKMLEERQIVKNYKIGLIHLLPGQTQEHQALSNDCGAASREVMDFMLWLGDGRAVALQGWKKYRAGLDVVSGTSGERAIYTEWNNYEIVFHCAPLLPFDPNDSQQVERRRFIGNDIVVIVFKEGDDEEQFDLESVGSKHNHIICVVRPIHNPISTLPSSYRVAIATRNNIPDFDPIDFPAVLQRDDESRNLLLFKLISGERAAYKSKSFATQLLRTRTSLLQDVIKRCAPTSLAAMTAAKAAAAAAAAAAAGTTITTTTTTTKTGSSNHSRSLTTGASVSTTALATSNSSNHSSSKSGSKCLSNSRLSASSTSV